MGWCSGTAVFDSVLRKILYDNHFNDEQRTRIIRYLVDALEDHDWDCQADSDYWEHPLVAEVFYQLYPTWFDDESYEE
jgi:hypothetical protein